MRHRDRLLGILLGAIVAGLLASANPTHAGFGDALKQKMKEKAAKKAAEAVDKAAEKPAATKEGEPKDAAAAADAKAEASGPSAKVSEVSTKFDYVPGDKVILLDDFTQDDLGEFPVRWKPVLGTFEVAESAGERWFRCTSPDGTVRLKLPDAPALPEYWTLEFDFLGVEPLSSSLIVRALGKGDYTIWEATYPNGNSLFFRSGEYYSTTPLEGVSGPGGRHHVMVMARKTGIKVYMDQQRLASMPEVWNKYWPAVALEIRLWANTKPMITNVRYAEGCKPAPDLLATGKLVTYGIRFATGSDVVLAESAPVLRQVAAWLQANPAAKLTITGHTDNVGSAADNLDLSKRRAASVARVLSEQFSIVADRLATQGKGDTQSLADNAKVEGRAMNRRVEFTKL